MELFDIVVKRYMIHNEHIQNNKFIGQPDEYVDKMKKLKEKVSDDELFEKACLFEAVNQSVFINIKNDKKTISYEISPILMLAFNTSTAYPKRLAELMDEVKYKYISNIEDYSSIIDDVLNGNSEDDDWFFDNQDMSNQDITSYYYRRKIVELIDARFSYEKVSLLYDFDLIRDEDHTPLKTLDDLKRIFEEHSKQLESNRKASGNESLDPNVRVSAADSLDSLVKATDTINTSASDDKRKPNNFVERLNSVGIRKQVFYNYKNGKEVEFSKKFYFILATFLSFTGYKTETFLNIHGLSYQDSKTYNSELYRNMFDYGLSKEFLNYMLDARELEKSELNDSPKKLVTKKRQRPTKIQKEQREIIAFKKTFNAKDDYFALLDKVDMMTSYESTNFASTLSMLEKILKQYITQEEPKVEKRLRTIENYKKTFKDKDYLDKRVKGAERFLNFDLSKILNKSIIDTEWDVTYSLKDLINLRETISKQLKDIKTSSKK